MEGRRDGPAKGVALQVGAANSSRTEESEMEVGVIGLGKMGTGIAKSLLRAGHRVTVFNRTRTRAEA